VNLDVYMKEGTKFVPFNPVFHDLVFTPSLGDPLTELMFHVREVVKVVGVVSDGVKGDDACFRGCIIHAVFNNLQRRHVRGGGARGPAGEEGLLGLLYARLLDGTLA